VKKQKIVSLVLTSVLCSALIIPVQSSASAYRAFTTDSYWNTPMPANAPIDPNSATYIQDSIDNGGAYIKVPTVDYQTPVFFAATSDPIYTVTPTAIGPTVTLHIPADAEAAPGNDGQLIVYDESTNQVVGLHHATFDTTWHADGTDRYYLDSEGLEQSIGGTTGNIGHRGVPGPVRTVRYEEVQDGVINHRLECFWWATASSHVFPMSGHENNKGGIVPEGMVARIKPSVNLDNLGLNSQALVIAKALQQYGCVVGDNSGSGNKVKIEVNPNWNLSGTAFQAVPWSSWEFIEAGYDPRDDVATPQSKSFQNGVSPTSTYSGTIDTMIKESAPNTASGGATTIFADGDDPGSTGEDDAILLRWNVGAIPAGSTVTAASITFDVTDFTNSTGYNINELKRAWTEGGATWNNYKSGTSWQIAGAEGSNDRGSTVLGTVNPTVTGSFTVNLNQAGLAVIQNWIDDSTSNHGLIITNESTNNGLGVSSSEASTKASRPELTITYTD
jgi:hypothetical protein